VVQLDDVQSRTTELMKSAWAEDMSCTLTAESVRDLG
jgi:hypothetical protein